jgi:2-dehydro-3-deoxygalactonokinase
MAAAGRIAYRASGQATEKPGKLMPSSSSPNRQPALIGVDWGTSSCRAYLLDRTGRTIETAAAAKGVLHVESGAFGSALDELIGHWRRPGLPVLLSGMIGSRQGWIEAPYVDVPATFDRIAAAMIPHPDDPSIHIVPGLAQDFPDQAPDVMRGEETQIIGALGEESGRRLLVTPGTHSKWALAEDQKVVWFATFMTGELFAVLKEHSILGRLMAADATDDQGAFEQGLDAARRLPGGLLGRLFSARTLPLFERLATDGVAAYLSGLLIGQEIAEALGRFEAPPDRRSPIVVIGASALAARYARALDRSGLASEAAVEDAAARGHFKLAGAAGLLTDSKGEPR